ncbi:hypothetical protein C5F49_03150 [Nitrosopumilus oxyclinae]|uniref:Uncharacterized protein n=1 Tax=Nitrosopumilus oxyclinae TaxID=1959104 RepID=A0A7D5R8L0_9ARCH|nr:hypothetical protein [Nitrosopumilus oxyclinae]QLH04422.1 hypothetical protein C5F49_03150 [Nitrosopumilus oxyclinae]
MNYEKLCETIFGLDKQIRFVAVYSKNYEKIAGGMREGTKTLSPESITRLSVEQAFDRWTTRLQMGEYIGAPKYALAEYEKLKRFTFHVGGNALLLISTELGISNDLLIENVLKTIRQ